VHNVRERHRELLDRIEDTPARADRLCELNVIEQVRHVCQTTVVQDAWRRGQTLSVHGWIYGLRDGLLRDLGFTVNTPAEIEPTYSRALASVATGNGGKR
jgi:carbonic anhydrase